MLCHCDACGETYDLNLVGVRCVYCGALRCHPVEPKTISDYGQKEGRVSAAYAK